MHLTAYSDYAMRALLYLGARTDRLCSTAEIARAYGISQNHLVKVVHDLRRAGYIASVRGRLGGLRLAMPAEDINVGTVIRHTENDFQLVDCPGCLIGPVCGLSGAFDEAVAAFLKVLDSYTLADLLTRRSDMLELFLTQRKAETTPPPAQM